ncbi:MAG: DUF3999 family protein [Chloroflexi bacterium]|nr:DUF3999 family protein [Chloroflexota bacterium]
MMPEIPHSWRLLVAVVTLWGVALAPLVSLADFSLGQWRWYKQVALPSSLGESALAEIVPDAQVFEGASLGLGDLRVVEEATQQEMPYKLLVERGEQRRSSVGGSLRDLGVVPGQYTTFVVDLGKEGLLHNEVEIKTPSENFQRQVVVETSADASGWAVVQSDGQVFDFTLRDRSVNQRLARVRYPSSTARYLRVRILDGEEPPLQVTGAAVYSSQELPPREVGWPAALTGRTEDAAARRSVVLLDVGAKGLPISRLALRVPQQNFYREVQVEGSNDAQTWAYVGSGPVYDYHTPKISVSSLSLGFAEVTFRYFRLTIQNQDNPPLPVEAARAYDFLRKLIFEGQPGASYRLYYGNPQARAPVYDFERVFPYLVTEDLPQGVLGGQTLNPDFTGPLKPSVPLTERYTWLLPVAVGLGSLLIGLFLASLLRQVRKALPPPPG